MFLTQNSKIKFSRDSKPTKTDVTNNLTKILLDNDLTEVERTHGIFNYLSKIEGLTVSECQDFLVEAQLKASDVTPSVAFS